MKTLYIAREMGRVISCKPSKRGALKDARKHCYEEFTLATFDITEKNAMDALCTLLRTGDARRVGYESTVIHTERVIK